MTEPTSIPEEEGRDAFAAAFQSKVKKLTCAPGDDTPHPTVPLLDEITKLLANYTEYADVKGTLKSIASLNNAVRMLGNGTSKDRYRDSQLLRLAPDILRGASQQLEYRSLAEDRVRWSALKPHIEPWLQRASEVFTFSNGRAEQDFSFQHDTNSQTTLQRALGALMTSTFAYNDHDTPMSVPDFFRHLLNNLRIIEDSKSQFDSYNCDDDLSQSQSRSRLSSDKLWRTKVNIETLRSTLAEYAVDNHIPSSHPERIVTTRALATMKSTFDNYLALILNAEKEGIKGLPSGVYANDTWLIRQFTQACNEFDIGNSFHFHGH